MRLLTLVLVALAAVACSDRVPAPATPTPSPRPGYPPAPASELPEGVLYVNNPTLQAPPPVFRIEAGKEAEEIAPLFVASVLPDSSRAAVVTVGSGRGPGPATGLGILTGSGLEEIEGSLQAAWAPMLWSNDGRLLAYTVPENDPAGKVNIWTLDVESGEQTLLTEEADSFWMLGWTAAGDVLVSASVGLALLGSTQRAVTLPEPGTVLDAQVSPDGRAVAVRLGEYEQDAQTEAVYIRSAGIWLLDLGNSQWREVVELEGEPPIPQTTAGELMSWSPDGRRLAYHSPIGPGWPYDRFGLDVVDVVTGERTHIVDRPIWTEAWSPDGQYFAFLYQNPKAENRLGLLGPDGRTGEVDKLVRRMAWAKDGRLLVDIPGHLSLLDPATMELKEVQTEGGEAISALVETPVWSPSGRYFALSTPADMYHRSSLYVIDTKEGTAELFLDEAGFAPVAWLRE